MSKFPMMSLGLAVAALALAAPVSAQGRTAVTTAELEAAVTTRPSGNREAVRNFLATPQARSVADRMGVGTSDLSAGVASLDQTALDQIAEQIGVVDRAGGDQKIIISTTVIIIALLILILLVK